MNIEEFNSFIQKLFESLLFYYIFKHLKNIEKYIVFSINRVYSPFYFYCLLQIIDVNNDCNLSKNNKKEILEIIMTKIIIMINTNKINSLNNNNKISNESLNKNSIVI